MIDTFAISKTFLRPPNQSDLERQGWKTVLDRHTGKLTALCLNAPKDSHKPRLTLSKNRNDWWIIRAEVSLGSWLCGSNLHLPDEDELHHGLDELNEYVESKSGIFLDAHAERVSRVDFTRDFQVGENSVIPILSKFARLDIPRYKRVCFDETSVYFKNAGKLQTKRFLIYSKHHERLANGKDKAEQEAAKGLIRLEVSLRKSAVNRLAKSLKLPNHNANHILTKETSEKALQTAMKQLNFDSLLSSEETSEKDLFDLYGATMAYNLIGFLWLKDKYGEDFKQQEFIKTSPKTLKRYSDNCLKAGILSLE